MMLSKNKLLKLAVGLSIAVMMLTSCAPAIAASMTPVSDEKLNLTSTTEASPTLTPTKTKEPTAYHVEATGGEYTEAQQALNNSQSAKDQEARIQRWLDYWIHFKNRPLEPGAEELTWKYLYNNLDNPTEVAVLLEAGGEYKGQLFTVPLGKGRGDLADYPPKEIKEEYGYGPLNLTSGNNENVVGQWLSVKYGTIVRRDSNNKVVARLDLEAGGWKEIKQFEICTPENFRDCPITVEDLLNGDYAWWLDSLSQPFDLTKIKYVPLANYHFGEHNIQILYDVKSTPNWNKIEERSYRNDVTAAFLVYEGVDYIILPVELSNPKNPNENDWVVTATSTNYDSYKKDSPQKNIEKELEILKNWRELYNFTVIYASKFTPGNDALDPLMAVVYAKFPDMAARFGRFSGNGEFDINEQDPKALSEPGIVVLNKIARVVSGGHIFK